MEGTVTITLSEYERLKDQEKIFIDVVNKENAIAYLDEEILKHCGYRKYTVYSANQALIDVKTHFENERKQHCEQMQKMMGISNKNALACTKEEKPTVSVYFAILCIIVVFIVAIFLASCQPPTQYPTDPIDTAFANSQLIRDSAGRVIGVREQMTERSVYDAFAFSLEREVPLIDWRKKKMTLTFDSAGNIHAVIENI